MQKRFGHGTVNRQESSNAAHVCKSTHNCEQQHSKSGQSQTSNQSRAFSAARRQQSFSSIFCKALSMETHSSQHMMLTLNTTRENTLNKTRSREKRTASARDMPLF